jgi:hypothetical protein
MKKLFKRMCTSTGQRLLTMGRRSSSEILPGTIVVSGYEVKSLRPLGGFRQPGVTKAGRLSFAGVYKGRKVKVYSGHSAAQNALRQDIQLLDFKSCGFPEVLAVDKDLVVEAWVEGKSVSELKGRDFAKAETAILHFLEENTTRTELQAIAAKHPAAFCYFRDYLLPRLGKWRHLSFVEDFISAWQARYLQLEAPLGSHLTHPDLSAANIVRDSTTGRFIIIDNELIGVGRGWILDRYNSFLAFEGPPDVSTDFIALTWRLRQLGSAIDAGDLPRAQSICQGEDHNF